MPRAGRIQKRVSAQAVPDAVQLKVRSAASKSPAAPRGAVARGADVNSDSIRLAPATVPPSRTAGRASTSRHASLLTTPAAAPSGSKGVQTVEIRPAGTVVSRRAATNRPAIRHLPQHPILPLKPRRERETRTKSCNSSPACQTHPPRGSFMRPSITPTPIRPIVSWPVWRAGLSGMWK